MSHENLSQPKHQHQQQNQLNSQQIIYQGNNNIANNSLSNNNQHISANPERGIKIIPISITSLNC